MIPGLNIFPEGQIIAFALVLLRVASFVVSWPIFGSGPVPNHVKILLALCLSMVVFPVVNLKNAQLIGMNDQLVFMVFREVVIGLFLGYLLRFFFFAISISGEIIGISSGLASAQIYNPAMGGQTNVFEQYNNILATLFLLLINGHHLFIQGLVQSFDLVPIADVALKSQSFLSVALLVQEAFFFGIKMAAPVFVAVFLTNVTMGVVGRTVPQMNVFMTSMQVTVLVTMGVMMISLPFFVDELGGLLQIMSEKFFTVMKVL